VCVADYNINYPGHNIAPNNFFVDSACECRDLCSHLVGAVAFSWNDPGTYAGESMYFRKCHCKTRIGGRTGVTGVQSGPTTPGQDGWYDGGDSQSCEAGCAAHGLVCTEEQLFLHNGDVDSNSEVLALVARVGGSTSDTQCNGDYGTSRGIPCWHSTGCWMSSENRPLNTFDCQYTTNPDAHKHRLCYCHQACWEQDMRIAGNDITEVTAPSISQCQLACQGQAGCLFFTWRTNQRCFLKTSDAGKSAAIGAVSGPVRCQEEPPTPAPTAPPTPAPALPEWYKGQIHQDCNAVCQARGGLCNEDALDVMQRDGSSWQEMEGALGPGRLNQYCPGGSGQMVSSTNWDIYGPFEHQNGNCYLHNDFDTSQQRNFMCIANADWVKRICFCVPQGWVPPTPAPTPAPTPPPTPAPTLPEWYKGQINQDCDTVCQAHGGLCNEDALDTMQRDGSSWEAMAGVLGLNRLGQWCPGARQMVSSTNWDIYGPFEHQNGNCYIHNDFDTSQQRNFMCIAEAAWVKRICFCVPNGWVPPTPAPTAPPTPAPSSLPDWYEGSFDQSCNTVCQGHGGQCNNDALDFMQNTGSSIDALRLALGNSKYDQFCPNGGEMVSSTNWDIYGPHLHTNGNCYLHNDFDTSDQRNFMCISQGSARRRICYCVPSGA
jgi:hypothetical protein